MGPELAPANNICDLRRADEKIVQRRTQRKEESSTNAPGINANRIGRPARRSFLSVPRSRRRPLGSCRAYEASALLEMKSQKAHGGGESAACRGCPAERKGSELRSRPTVESTQSGERSVDPSLSPVQFARGGDGRVDTLIQARPTRAHGRLAFLVRDTRRRPRQLGASR